MLTTRCLLVLSLGGVLATPLVWADQEPTAGGRGLILGRVVDGTTGRPISEAVVSIGRGGRSADPPRMSAPGILAPERDLLQPVVTGADGRFVFRDLAAGTYPLKATSAGYIAGTAGQGRPGGPARAIDLADGERLGDVTIRLWKYAVVGGTIFDEAGEPAMELEVQVFRRTVVAGKPQFAPGATGQTDDRGRYRIGRLTPGDYVIGVPQTQSTVPSAMVESVIETFSNSSQAVPAPPAGYVEMIMSGMSSRMFASVTSGVRVGDVSWGASYGGAPPPAATGRAAGYQTTFYPAAVSPALATPVTLGSGEDRDGLDITLPLVPTVRVSGTVTGQNGPIPNLAVRLVLTGHQGLLMRNEFDTASAVTRPDGTFMLIGVPPGQYVACVRKAPVIEMPGAAPATAASASTPTVTQPMLFTEMPVAVGTVDISGLSLVLREGPKVSGRITFTGTSPAMTPEQLQAIYVELQSADGLPGPYPVWDSTRTPQNGAFVLNGYQPGRYFVTVVVAGGNPGPWTMRSATPAGRDVMNEPLELKDADIRGVVITFADRASQLSGTVRTATSGSVAAATVIIFPADYRTWFVNGMSAQRTRSIASKRSGAYVATPLPAGDYLVAAVDDAEVSDTQDSAFFEALARVATRVTIREAEGTIQDLRIVRVVR